MKWIYIGLSVSFVALTLLLFMRDDTDIRFGTEQQSYSWYHTDPLETIQIDTIINQPNTFHVDINYIEQISLSDGETSLAMELIAIKQQEHPIMIDAESFTHVTWMMRPKVIPTSTVITLDAASLHVSYRNGDRISLPLGDIHYVFQDDLPTGVALTGLSATYQDIGGFETVSGVQIGLKNRTTGMVEIRSIHVLSSTVMTNTKMMVRDIDCQDVVSVTACLGIDDYSFLVTPVPSDMHELILPGQDTTFYIPLSYQTPIPFHRFVIQVTYQQAGVEYHFYMDDFPFLSTTPFASNQVEEYNWYVIDHDS